MRFRARSFKWMAYMLGFREEYYTENMFMGLSTLVAVISYALGISRLLVLPLIGALMLLPFIFQYNMYRSGYRPNVRLPLSITIMAAINTYLYPPLFVAAIPLVATLEDFTVFFGVDVMTVKRGLRLMVAPLERKETVTVFVSVLAVSTIVFMFTGQFLVLAYPVIAYGLALYSIIVVPRELLPERRRVSFFESLTRRMAAINLIVYRFYNKPEVRVIGKQGGYLGARYNRVVRRTVAAFTLAIYMWLAVLPLSSYLLGLPLSLLAALGSLLAIFFAPYLLFKSRASSRKQAISRNVIFILSYFAAMKSVAESFARMMLHLAENKNLAKLFGLEREADYYKQIFLIKGSEGEATYEYADTIPDDYLRDTVRTMEDLDEHEGSSATFRMVVTRLRDYTARYVNRVRTLFENVGANVLAMSLIVEVVLPILNIISSPGTIYMYILLGGLITFIVAMFVSSSMAPNFPSEYTATKRRLLRASLVFAVTTGLLAVAEKLFVPEILTYALAFNIPVGIAMAVWYASKYELDLNNDLLNKFTDILTLFASAHSRHKDTSRAFLELSYQPAFNRRLKNLFKRLSRRFANATPEMITYKGVYWYKYLLFLTSLSAFQGTTPRRLYEVISDFVLQVKQLVAAIRNLALQILITSVIAFFILTIQIGILASLLPQFSSIAGASKELPAAGFGGFITSMTPEEVHAVAVKTEVSLLSIAIVNGLVIGKVYSGTFRDGRWVLILYLLELVLLYLLKTTGLGVVNPEDVAGVL